MGRVAVRCGASEVLSCPSIVESGDLVSGGLRDSFLALPEGAFVLGWRHIVERGVQAFFIVPRDPLDDRPLDLVDVLPGPCISINSALKVPFSASAMALSYESATEPTDAEAPISASRSVYRINTYWASSTGRCNTGLL